MVCHDRREQRSGMDRSRHLLFQQIEFQGLSGGTAAFMVAWAMRGLLVSAAGVLRSHRRGMSGAMAYDGEVGCEDDQQQ